MSILTAWRQASRDRMADHAQVDALMWAFRQSCIGAGVALPVDSPVCGTSFRTPEVTYVQLGPPTVLTVRCLEGTVPAQLRAVGSYIAPHLGGLALRVVDRGGGWCLITVLDHDPLAGTLQLDLGQPGVLLGRDEGGVDIRIPHPRDLPHIIVQGQTRSGKSIWLYSLLAQVARGSDIVVAGVDPSGITLRPVPGDRRWLALGLADYDRIEAVLTDLVAEMDHRLSVMPHDRDILPTSAKVPVILVVLDEYPALLRALDAAATRDDKPGVRVRALIARLLAESHKVGFRVVIAAQRAEASIVGAAERAQCAGRLSFRVDSLDSVKLLHPDAAELAGDHTSSPPGIALLSWPSHPLRRIRGPLIGTYTDYAAALGGAS